MRGDITDEGKRDSERGARECDHGLIEVLRGLVVRLYQPLTPLTVGLFICHRVCHVTPPSHRDERAPPRSTDCSSPESVARPPCRTSRWAFHHELDNSVRRASLRYPRRRPAEPCPESRSSSSPRSRVDCP